MTIVQKLERLIESDRFLANERFQRWLIRKAVSELHREVNRRAEADIVKGNPITGAHHRKLEEVVSEVKKGLR